MGLVDIDLGQVKTKQPSKPAITEQWKGVTNEKTKKTKQKTLNMKDLVMQIEYFGF